MQYYNTAPKASLAYFSSRKVHIQSPHHWLGRAGSLHFMTISLDKILLSHSFHCLQIRLMDTAFPLWWYLIFLGGWWSHCLNQPTGGLPSHCWRLIQCLDAWGGAMAVKGKPQWIVNIIQDCTTMARYYLQIYASYSENSQQQKRAHPSHL